MSNARRSITAFGGCRRVRGWRRRSRRRSGPGAASSARRPARVSDAAHRGALGGQAPAARLRPLLGAGSVARLRGSLRRQRCGLLHTRRGWASPTDARENGVWKFKEVRYFPQYSGRYADSGYTAATGPFPKRLDPSCVGKPIDDIGVGTAYVGAAFVRPDSPNSSREWRPSSRATAPWRWACRASTSVRRASAADSVARVAEGGLRLLHRRVRVGRHRGSLFARRLEGAVVRRYLRGTRTRARVDETALPEPEVAERPHACTRPCSRSSTWRRMDIRPTCASDCCRWVAPRAAKAPGSPGSPRTPRSTRTAPGSCRAWIWTTCGRCGRAATGCP
jgi:hypothetical protein